MNKGQTIEAMKIMQAYVDGHEIQFNEPRVDDADKWTGFIGCGPSWDLSRFKYRKKPKPLELWVNVYHDGAVAYLNINDAKTACGSSARTIKMVEVTDG